jgi:hypothetical protein
MKLCVVYQRLTRIHLIAKNRGDVKGELLTIRKFDPKKYIEWLVFEFEGLLQIRPEQYDFAMHLIENPGSISQLSMGLGKTRVIVPMICLYWLHNLQKPLIRLCFLEALLLEAVEFLQNYLTASVFQIPVFILPFNREVDLEMKNVYKIMDTIKDTEQLEGSLAISPLQRLSLLLKIYEQTKVGVFNDLLNVLCNDNWCDLLDESDSILSYKFQLVYANGTPKELESGQMRWTLMEEIMLILNNDAEISQLLKFKPKQNGEYNEIMFNTTENDLLKSILYRIMNLFFKNPPRSSNWIKKNKIQLLKNDIIEMIIHVDKPAHLKLPKEQFDKSEWEQLLLLRGLLGHGILSYVLSKRVFVDYGIDVRREKKIAVPFIGADIPTDRAEFAHPDISILFTILAFYYKGLEMSEFHQAILQFLRLGSSAKDAKFREWMLDISKSEITNEELETFVNYRKIDISNNMQQQYMFKYLKRNMNLIHLYLNRNIFPEGTRQYPEKHFGTSWDLVDSKRVNGFSGTNDNKKLLPLQVTQLEPKISSLLGTNGRVLQLLFENSSLLQINNDGWKCLLDAVANSGVHALIDTGSLLGGASNANVALYLSKKDSFKFTCKRIRSSINCSIISRI